MPTDVFSGKLAGAPLKLTFDDVLIEPRRSGIESRSDVDLSTYLGRVGLTIPIISANMDTVTDYDMAKEMSLLGGIGVIHRFQDHKDLVDKVRSVQGKVGAAIGFEATKNHVENLYLAGCDLLVLDVAHGHMEKVLSTIGIFKSGLNPEIFDSMPLCVGNVVTRQGARDLFKAGADIIKVGVGPGSACTTRMKTGCGYPQLSAIAQCSDIAREYDGSVIADGGIKNSGDIVKALAAGADAVMLGGLLAGTDEAAGETRFLENLGIDVDPVPIKKRFRGMASVSAARDNGKSLYTPEGEEGWVKYKGDLAHVIKDLEGGIRSGMSYAGCINIAELHQKANFVRITPSTHKESQTRGMIT